MKAMHGSASGIRRKNKYLISWIDLGVGIFDKLQPVNVASIAAREATPVRIDDSAEQDRVLGRKRLTNIGQRGRCGNDNETSLVFANSRATPKSSTVTEIETETGIETEIEVETEGASGGLCLNLCQPGAVSISSLCLSFQLARAA